MNTTGLPLQVTTWRDSLSQGQFCLKQAYFTRTSAKILLAGLAALVDKHLVEIWNQIKIPSDMSLIAVGGYGRNELYPYSDIDLLILLPDEQSQQTDKLEYFISILWDIGLNVGHSIRTIDDCIHQAEIDVTVLTNLLESRLLYGSQIQFKRFRQAINMNINRTGYAKSKYDEQVKRHLRYHNTAYNLEPNLKESPGGLRDLHSILWIASGLGIGSSYKTISEAGFLTRQEVNDLHSLERKLADLRIHLHYLARRREDRLLFEYQELLAKQIGFTKNSHRLASEQFMQYYFLIARSVSLYNEILLQEMRVAIEPGSEQPHPEGIYYHRTGHNLSLNKGVQFETNPDALLDGFVRLAMNPKLESFSPDTLRAIKQSTILINKKFRDNPTHQQQFITILNYIQTAPKVLRLMNHYRVLGKYIPAFGRIIGLMQHDLFHVYTVDEHILFVLANLGRFFNEPPEDSYPLPYKLMRDFRKPEVLLLAALFHDIAKGRGGDHSRLGMKDIKRFCNKHYLDSNTCLLASWLVENHLIMSATSQKKDLSDPVVIKTFAHLVKDEYHLDALMLLTIADIQGTNPDIWNAWKGRLLVVLYEQTKKYLRGELSKGPARISEKQNQARRKMIQHTLPSGIEHQLWATLDEDYFIGEEVEDIVWHAKILNQQANTKKTIVKARILPNKQGIKVLVYTPTQPALFLKLSRTFEHLQFNIVEARLYTTITGYALDSFVVLNENLTASGYRDLINFIEYQLHENICNSDIPFSKPTLYPRINRQLRHFPITPEVKLENRIKTGEYTILLLAGDRPGLLSVIAQVLHNAQINIQSARINTLGHRAEDSFYVRTKKLTDLEKKELQNALLEALETK